MVVVQSLKKVNKSGLCECGHQSCFHTLSSINFFNRSSACKKEGCECLRFTKCDD